MIKKNENSIYNIYLNALKFLVISDFVQFSLNPIQVCWLGQSPVRQHKNTFTSTTCSIARYNRIRIILSILENLQNQLAYKCYEFHPEEPPAWSFA